MNDTPTTPPKPSAADLQSAKKELTKLPLLGPALWLFARDPQRKFTFLADMDWRLLPPLVLDQCRLYSKEDVPWAFFTWAFVSDAVDQRLRSTSPIIAPHEWRSGDKAWLIDVVTPFGGGEPLAIEAIKQFAPGKAVSAWVFDDQGKASLKEFRPNG